MGSPDLEKALLFGFWCSNSHAQNVQANRRFCLLARGSNFSKGALRAVGAMAFVAAAPQHMRQRCTSKQLLTARCAARAFLFAVRAAAVLRAHQLCSWSTSRSKSKERGAWSIGKKSAAALRWLQCKLQPTLWNSTFPPVFFQRKWPFSPLPSQNFRLRRASLTPMSAGRRCAARIGYPNRHHHTCMVRHGRRRPGTIAAPQIH